jgi:uncharacterized protein involved in type VI secretion and phage assembly
MPEDHSLTVGLEVDGSPLDDALRPLLDEVVVDDYLHLPDMVTIRFLDIDRSVVSTARIKIGSKIKVTATPLGGQSAQPLIEAEVTAIEADYTPSGSLAIVRGYDQLHRFHRGRQTQTYVQMKDSEIASQIAQRVGVEVGEITESDHTEEYVAQTNETDWTFLQRRAREIGYQLAVDDGKFSYTKVPQAHDAPAEGDLQSSNPLQLVFGSEDLLEFHPRLSSAEQVGDVQVRGWDMSTKKAVVGRAQAAAGSASLQDSPASLAGIFGTPPTFTIVDRPLSTQTSVDATSKAIADRIGSAFAEAVGIARGNPALTAGAGVSVAGVAPEFVGQYVITSARHVFGHDGYKTKFTVSGQLDRSTLGLTTAGLSMRPDESPVNGVAIGLVTANDDPDKLGRVKLKLPWLADGYESTWVRIVSLGAGPNSGAVWLPEVNDEVLVAFDHGDMRRPFVLGGLWNGQDKPLLGDGLVDSGNGVVKRRGFVSRKGHKFVFFDDPNDSGIALISSNGDYKLALNESATKIHIKSGGTIEIESTQDITIKSSAGISLEADGQLKLKGSAVKIEGSAGVDIDGTPITLN